MSAVWSNQNVRQAGEHPALVGDLVGQHDVEHRDAVARDHQQPVVTDLVELADLARVEVRQRGRSAHRRFASIAVERVERAADVGERALRGRSTRRAGPSSSAAVTSGSSRAASRNERSSCHARIALRCTIRYASSRLVPALDQREQHRLAEHEPERRVEVAQHALGIHAHALDEPRELHEHVVREHQRVGEDDALDRRVRDVALVPQRDVLERRPAGCRAARARARRAARDLTGLRLCGIALEPFCSPSRNGSSTSRTSVRCRWRISSANDSIARADRRARVQHLGVPVAREHLRRRAPASSPRCSHTYCSTAGSTFEYVPTAPDSLPTAIASRARAQPLAVAAHLQRPQRELHAERRRLGVDAVRAADHRRVAELAGPVRDRRLRARPRASRMRSSARVIWQRERGVDDVARREPVVHPRAGGLADALLHDVDERGDVVIGDPLAFVDRGDVEAGALADRDRGVASGRRRARAQASTASTSTSSHAPKRASSVNRSAISGSE